MASRSCVCARAFTSISNLGYGFDVFAIAVDVGFDIVEVARGGSGLELAVCGEKTEDVPHDPELNTAGRAIRALREACGIRDPVRLRVQKGTRSGSGLGSSAASAAAAVVAADALFSLGLPRERLVQLAAEGERAAAGAAHTDNVAGSIYGGFVVFSNEPRPQVMHVHPPVSLRFVVALPAIHVRTAEARRLLPRELSLAQYCRGVARSAIAAVALAQGDLPAFGRAVEGSPFEQCRAPLIAGYRDVCDAARQAGALGVMISGAGPAMAAVSEVGADLAAIADAMRAAFARAAVASETFIARVAGGAELL